MNRVERPPNSSPCPHTSCAGRRSLFGTERYRRKPRAEQVRCPRALPQDPSGVSRSCTTSGASTAVSRALRRAARSTLALVGTGNSELIAGRDAVTPIGQSCRRHDSRTLTATRDGSALSLISPHRSRRAALPATAPGAFVWGWRKLCRAGVGRCRTALYWPSASGRRRAWRRFERAASGTFREAMESGGRSTRFC
jgi:hypothetical protein